MCFSSCQNNHLFHFLIYYKVFQNCCQLKNKIGNYIIKTIINKKYKSNILDTQTGLRGIPNKYVNELINVNGERFEYETKMLEYILKNKYKVNQIYIDTIYKKNIKSKFKTFKDSLEIIKSIAINI